MPLFFGGTGYIPPATGLNYLSWTIVGYIFQNRIRRRNLAWWSKYNYILSAGLDTGLAIGSIIVILCFSLSGLNGGEFPAWWGVTIAETTLDATDGAIKTLLAEGEYFGPRIGTF